MADTGDSAVLARLDERTQAILRQVETLAGTVEAQGGRLESLALCVEGQKVRIGLLSGIYGLLGGALAAGVAILTRLVK